MRSTGPASSSRSAGTVSACTRASTRAASCATRSRVYAGWRCITGRVLRSLDRGGAAGPWALGHRPGPATVVVDARRPGATMPTLDPELIRPEFPALALQQDGRPVV